MEPTGDRNSYGFCTED